MRSQSSGGQSSSPIPYQSLRLARRFLPGGSLPFSATVMRTSRTSVVWPASSGSISASGMLKVPSVTVAIHSHGYHTSTADNSSQASAVVIVAGVGPTITTASLAPGTVGVAYNSGLSASGGARPYQWSIVSGALPSGIHGRIVGSTMRRSITPSTRRSVSLVGEHQFHGHILRQSNLPA